MGTVCRPSPGSVLAAVGMYHDFQAFLGNFMDSMCKPCPGRVMATAMFGTHLGWDRDVAWFPGISRQFLGYDVQAMFGTRPDRSRRFRGRDVQAMFGMRPNCGKDVA
ncbi:Hypothetical predicted protein [Olea europaea subsp. europaea]|uniref:Uncharacterized protein n=1 Tax=Olea europaea subsp. europaea TaxID=158383 RepID=A0A8S0TQQ8_OLEEU|nr:Hypothetical predicted protein [Olea europaea subsp. europaea]